MTILCANFKFGKTNKEIPAKLGSIAMWVVFSRCNPHPDFTSLLRSFFRASPALPMGMSRDIITLCPPSQSPPFPLVPKLCSGTRSGGRASCADPCKKIWIRAEVVLSLPLVSNPDADLLFTWFAFARFTRLRIRCLGNRFGLCYSFHNRRFLSYKSKNVLFQEDLSNAAGSIL